MELHAKQVHLKHLKCGREVQPTFNLREAGAYAALGLIGGHVDDALRFIRIVCRGIQMNLHDDAFRGPITSFIWRILSEYAGESPVELAGDRSDIRANEVRGDAIMNDLHKMWRQPDGAALQTLCVAACDVHTHHSFSEGVDPRREFSGMSWTRTPLAVLLVFKLRQLKDLAIPKVDHPLLDDFDLSVISTPPGKPDPIVDAVRAQMERGGFDERAVFEDFNVKY